jgi:hypothetical protein
VIGDLVVRFLIGGAIVSLFSLLGDLLRPKSFAGLFAAAPSIALATLAFAGAKGAIEARSMILGAAGLFVYCRVLSDLLMKLDRPTHVVTLLTIPVWFGVSFGLWWAVLS